MAKKSKTTPRKKRVNTPLAIPGRSNWFETFFHGVALDLWRKCVSEDQTVADAEFIEEELGERTVLLDAPCGNGRHCLELARRGCQMTGLDIAPEFIAEATAAARKRKLQARFVTGDMRRLDWNEAFDGAFCLGNSFGYFEHPDMMTFLRAVSRALKPGGRFLIETGCAAESILPTLKERDWYQIDDILFAIENRYDAGASCLETVATFVREGRTELRRWWHWVYTVGELRRMLAEAGLTVRQLYGSRDRQPFTAGNPVLLILAEKESATSGRNARRTAGA
jgi:SAM-dependent methyltransferase